MKEWTRKIACGRSGIFLLLGSTLLWGGCALSVQGQQALPDTLLRDHASSATYYRKEAAKARKAAEAHEVMLLFYREGEKRAGSESERAEQSSLVKHCERVVQSFRDAAESLDALARGHGKEVGSPVPSVVINRGDRP